MPKRNPFPLPPCAVEGCQNPMAVRGWCNIHYTRWKRHGDPTFTLTPGRGKPLFCSIEGCDKPYEARGWCQMHYARWKKYGTPLPTDNFIPRTPNGDPLEWLETMLSTGDPEECWLWPFGTARGHGKIHFNGWSQMVHRVAYVKTYGPIPESLVLDHTCHNRDATCLGGDYCLHRRCINPAHLEAVTNKVNCYRGRQPGPRYRITVCKNGHSLIGPSNVYEWRGKRLCRQCRVEASKRNAAKRKAARHAQKLCH